VADKRYSLLGGSSLAATLPKRFQKIWRRAGYMKYEVNVIAFEDAFIANLTGRGSWRAPSRVAISA
jgi:hypothetical protein